ncbi:PAS domain S-box protein [Mucilaginibacter sp. SP1R1]|uniref:PAS domain S-box protein n=1 Tax=Mucilaginibacter sp. SP1R1 TaxID=2723091 RepID=UPI00161BCF91|nr:PAS domain S-box protein [Mucilaginibacter sp. SP1R1]MBB6151125.1 PAS domain S-box-containing protein [Mucilaginibacter sp. SP1R1]
MPENINKKIVEWDFEVANQPVAMLAYWDRNLICRYANQAYVEWFGKSPDEIIDKIKMPDLFGDLFSKSLPYIIDVLEGKVQRFERSIKILSGEVRKVITTYSPDYANGKVRGFFVHVQDITDLKSKPPVSQLNSFHDYENNLHFGQKILDEVVNTLKGCLLTGFPGITKLAKLHFISESKLKRDFKAKFKIGIFSYYRNLQMQLAEKYLEEKECSKKQLAAILNFSNPSNFSACYKKYQDTKSVDDLDENDQQETDERYKTFIAQAPFAIAMVDTDMRYLAFSGKWLTDYDYQADKLIGTVHEHIFPELKSKLKDVYRSSLNGEVNKCDEELVEKADGSVVWIRWDIRPWYNYKNVIGGLLICTEDISVLKQKYQENNKISEIFKKANEIAGIGTWKRDFKNNEAAWSNITKEMLELPESFEPGADLAFDFYQAGNSRNLVKKAFTDAFEKGWPFDIEANLVTAKGNLKRVRVIGYPEFIHGVCEKIEGIFQDISNMPKVK